MRDLPTQQKLTDAKGRLITYLRCSVTSRCTLRCSHCAGRGVRRVEPAPLSREAYNVVIRAAARLGVATIGFSGGEPLLRDDLVGIVQDTVAVPGITDVTLATNGVLLAERAQALHDAGLARISVGIDSLDPATYHTITGGELSAAHAGLDAACHVFKHVRLNMVVLNGINDHECVGFVRFARLRGIAVRFLEVLPVKSADTDKRFLSSAELRTRLTEHFRLEPIEPADGVCMAQWFRVDGGPQEIAFVSPVSRRLCAACNRLRLLSHGDIVPCVHCPVRVSLADALTQPDAEERVMACLLQAAALKPVMHGISSVHYVSPSCEMQHIGG